MGVLQDVGFRKLRLGPKGGGLKAGVLGPSSEGWR